MRVNSRVPLEAGTHQRLFQLESTNGAATVWTCVIKENGKFRNQGSREKFGSISYSDLHGLTVNFIPFPKKSLSDPPWVTPLTDCFANTAKALPPGAGNPGSSRSPRGSTKAETQCCAITQLYRHSWKGGREDHGNNLIHLYLTLDYLH